MKKRILSTFLVFVVFISMIGNTFAAARWSNVESADLYLSFNGSTALCGVDIIGNAGTSKIVATVELQVKNSNGNYVRSASWSTRTVSSRYFSFYEEAYNRSAGDYRLVVDATVYNANGVGEDIYIYFDRTYNGSTGTTG